MKFQRYISCLHSSDILIIVFGAFLSILNIAFAARIPQWWQLLIINMCGTVAIFALAYARSLTGWKPLALAHDLYAVPLVFIAFKELYFMIRPINGYRDLDDALIAIDRWLFGVDPTKWLEQFSYPWLTELLQISYTTFYFLFLLMGFELYRRHSLGPFHFFMFTCVYGFFLSYIGYLLVPAVGPRFTLHDFSALDQELPGLWLTPYLRWFVNTGESIPAGVSNSVSHALAQRDVFPSGHTMMMLVMISFAFHYRLSVRYFILINGTLLIIATVYQRYHYVIDLLGGAVFMVVCMYTAPWLYSFTRSHFNTIDNPYAWRETAA
jgi:membrane-associated phospholipid phosphatase